MLVFLKLGGSLITDKNTAHTAQNDTLRRLADEIKKAREDCPGLKILLGHGSGSFGHIPAKKYGTRNGVKSSVQWQGFAEVYREARALNEIVLNWLFDADLPVMSFPPSSAVMAADGKIAAWDIQPLQSALDAGLIPLIQGDTCFDTVRGGTILSTEDLFFHLAPLLNPRRILLAGIEAGVWADYPKNSRLIKEICPANFASFAVHVKGSAAADVTGGMADKVQQMLALVTHQPELEAVIFSGQIPGEVLRALTGQLVGTRICTDQAIQTGE